jgi:hypothetical protein
MLKEKTRDKNYYTIVGKRNKAGPFVVKCFLALFSGLLPLELLNL